MAVVIVLDDFAGGVQPPANPELLDWLACEFMDSGWDIKRWCRLMVNSQDGTKNCQFQAPSRPEPGACASKPVAELVRDNALTIAGLLVPKIRRAQCEAISTGGLLGESEFSTAHISGGHGRKPYRRGLYTWWQRSFLHPSLLAFDAPTREECTAERNRSNIPQQALVLLNDPTYVEAARAFAAAHPEGRRPLIQPRRINGPGGRPCRALLARMRYHRSLAPGPAPQ